MRLYSPSPLLSVLSHLWCSPHVHISHLQIFLFTARCYASAVLAMALCPSVRPSVRLSVTSRSSTKMAKQRITQTTPHDSAGTLVFLMPKISAKFYRGHPLRGRRMQVGWVKIGDFWLITGYISKTVQDRHGTRYAWFLLKSNRKSYALYRMVILPMTLSAPNYPIFCILHRHS